MARRKPKPTKQNNAELERRVAALEAVLFRRKAPSGAKKRGYTDITVAELDRRWNLRVEYEELKFLETCNRVYSRRRGDHVPTSLAYFAESVRDDQGKFSLRELQRYFCLTSTHAKGSHQENRITRAYRAEISRLLAVGYHIGMSQVEIERIHTRLM